MIETGGTSAGASTVTFPDPFYVFPKYSSKEEGIVRLSLELYKNTNFDLGGDPTEIARKSIIRAEAFWSQIPSKYVKSIINE